MSEQIVNSISLMIPEECKAASLPDGLPQGSSAFTAEREGTMAYVLFIPISLNHTMPRHHLLQVVSTMRESLGENEGIVDAGEGKSDQGSDMVYVIEKRKEADGSVTYTLYCHYIHNDKAVHIQAYFAGPSCDREKEVRTMLEKRNSLPEHWEEDPFDPSYRKGFLCTMAEHENFDGMFRSHPLTLCRAFRDYLAEEN